MKIRVQNTSFNILYKLLLNFYMVKSSKTIYVRGDKVGFRLIEQQHLNAVATFLIYDSTPMTT